MTLQGKPGQRWKSSRKANPGCPAKVNKIIFNLGIRTPMYSNHCLFDQLFNRYKSSLFAKTDERIFSMPSTPGMVGNIKVLFIFYVIESLCSLCLGDIFTFSSTLES
uniref:Transmembrane protein n=1 Tax=Medicago truncatula TaxID=3880 RepID=I3T2A7_MEDTR|nr:unknown [Medicago truncatula]